MRRARSGSSPASRQTRRKRGRSPIPSCSRTTTAIARSDDVAKTFGPGFARALFQLTPGAWAGPIESGYGWHLVWVDALTPARAPAFEEVEPDVKTAWIEEQRAEIRERAFDGDAGALRGRPAEGSERDGCRRQRCRHRPMSARSLVAGSDPAMTRRARMHESRRSSAVLPRCRVVPAARAHEVAARLSRDHGDGAAAATTSCGARRCSPACACRSR